MLQFPPNDSHEKTQPRGAEGAGPHEIGKSAASPERQRPMPTIQSPTDAECGHMWGEQSETFPGRPGDAARPNGDNSNPAVGSVELRSQGDQRKYEEQTRLKVPGDMRVTEGGQKSNPTEAMPGAE